MKDITHKQHLIMHKFIDKDSISEGEFKDNELETVWELVRGGYLHNLISLRSDDLIFKLKESGSDYVDKISKEL